MQNSCINLTHHGYKDISIQTTTICEVLIGTNRENHRDKILSLIWMQLNYLGGDY